MRSHVLQWTAVAVALLCIASPAWATDYYAHEDTIINTMTCHAVVIPITGHGTLTHNVPIEFCTGSTGCCCTEACRPADAEDCPDTACTGDDCCKPHPQHQTCCSEPGACCQAGSPPCSKTIATACITPIGMDCNAAGAIILCSGASCPTDGGFYDLLTVPTDMSAGELAAFQNGLRDIRVEFGPGEWISCPVRGAASKDPPAIPVASGRNLIILGAVLALGALFLLHRRMM